MAPLPIAARAAHQLARRATDPLAIILGERYIKSPVVLKIITWLLSLFIGVYVLILAFGIVGVVLAGIFLAVREVVMFVVRPLISGFRKLQADFEERRGRRREREAAGRGREESARRSTRRGDVINVNVQIGQKDGDVELGGLCGRNQGPLPMPLRTGLPPAYSLSVHQRGA